MGAEAHLPSTSSKSPPTIDSAIYLGIFLLGVFRGSWTALAVPFPFGFGFEPLAIARSLVAHGTFADPYTPLATGPTAHSAPLYPLVMAAMIRLFGDGPRAAFMSGTFVLICFATLLCLLPMLSRRLFDEYTPGVIAASLAIIIPIFPAHPHWDAVPSAFISAATCLVSLQSRRLAFAVGILGGLGILTTTSILLFLAPWIAALVFARRWRIGDAAIAGVIAFVICLPWMLRNQFTLGVFGLRDDFGLELFINNNDVAKPSFHGNRTALHLSPNSALSEAQLVKQLGEKEYNARKLAQAKAWIMAHPARFLWLSVQRWFFFWFPATDEPPFCYGMWLVTAISIPGAWLAVRQSPILSLGLIAGTVAFSSVYSVVNADLRYRIPVVWVTLLFAGVALTAVLQRLRAYRNARLAGQVEATPRTQVLSVQHA